MRRSYIICLLFSTLIFSCKKSEINSFSKVIERYDSKLIYSDKNDVLGEITDIEILDSTIIMKHMNDHFYFSFANINDGKLVKRWGRKGRGPGEYIQLGSGISIFEKKLVFLDGIKKEINKVSVIDIINDNDIKITKNAYPYTKDFRPKDLNIINDKKIAIGSFKDGRFGVLDSRNRIIEYSSEYPFNYEKVKGIYKGSVFQSKLKSSAANSKFVIQTFSSDIFEIYEVTDNSILNIFVSPFKHIPKIKQRTNKRLFTIDSHKSIAGLMSMAVSNELICFTYSSKSYFEARDSGFTSDEILCFDWNGNKIRKYRLPFPIAKFCIDEKHIYGVRYHKDETMIYQFKL